MGTRPLKIVLAQNLEHDMERHIEVVRAQRYGRA
jgi:hypothetical protein